MKSEKTILDAEQIRLCIEKIADSIVKEFGADKISQIGFLGIQANGVPLAERISAEIEKVGVRPSCGALDISMFRDDIGAKKEIFGIRETSIPFDVEESIVILVDDVLHTGRTIRAALDAITNYGRPSMIRLAVLIDRGGREFPIQPDYVGKTVQVPTNARIIVNWQELDKEDRAYIEE
ncbi:MAG: bifunctional pyr operon transcriptional regulator/uracil phosphoribosyltransferase PyrR [Candidatus Nanoarchaeia archaeon]